MCTTLYRTKPFSIVLKRTSGNVYDPVSYSNFQYRTKTDQWKCVRPCIVQNHSVSNWNGPMGMSTTLNRTQTFSIVLKRTNGNLYDPVSYWNFQFRTKTDQGKCVRPCIVQNHSVSYWNGPMEMFTTLYRTETDRWECVRPYIVCKLSVSY